MVRPVEVGGSPRQGFFGTGRAARPVPIGSITGLTADKCIQVHTNTRLNYFTFFAINP
jgi:tRNA (Thr-GGU) A37 N-methylase